MKTLRKMGAMLLVLVLMLNLAACGKKQEAAPTAEETKTAAAESQTGAQEKEYPPVVSEPTTITFWHTRATGVNSTNLEAAVEEFNKTNEYGITVEQEYIGSYSEVMAKCSTAIAAGNNPELIIASEGGIGTMGMKNQYQDLAPYVERDGFDMSDFHQSLLTSLCIDTDGDGEKEIIGLPYVRSITVAIHNTKLFESIGVAEDEIPDTIEELVPMWKKIYETTGKYGFAMFADPSFYQDGLIQSLAVQQTGTSNGGVATNATSADCLTDGTMLKMLQDWSDWCEEGWSWRYTITDTANVHREMFYNGEVATVFLSCGSLRGIINHCGAGTTVDNHFKAMMQPGYGGNAGRVGGGNLMIIPQNHTDQEIDATWQFMKFLMSSEQVAKNSVDTGYLCVTKSGLEDPYLVESFNAEPNYWVAHNELEGAFDASLILYRDNWNAELKKVFSAVIVDESMTPQEAVDYLKDQAAVYLVEE